MYFDIVMLPLFLRVPFLYFLYLSSTYHVSSLQIFKDFRNSSNLGLRVILLHVVLCMEIKLNNRSLSHPNLFLCLAGNSTFLPSRVDCC